MTFNPLAAYASMYLIRHAEAEIARRYPDEQMRQPVHLSVGQESPAVGVIQALPAGAHVFGGHRSHAHYLAKGGDLDALIAELHGKATGCCGGREGSMHIRDRSVGFIGAFPLVGDAVSLAVGDALSAKLTGEPRVSVAFGGDSVPETGQFWESINVAALHKLRLLVVIENNGYATQTPLMQRQPARSLTERVIGILPCYSLKDLDVEDVYTRVRFLLDITDMLPAVLEVHTYRWLEHVGYQDDGGMGYRSREEIDAHKALDPVARLRGKLPQWSGAPVAERDIVETERAVEERVRTAFLLADAAPWPEEMKVTDRRW